MSGSKVRLTVAQAQEMLHLLTHHEAWCTVEGSLKVQGATFKLPIKRDDLDAKAVHAIRTIDQRIELFSLVKDARVREWKSRKAKKAGRRSPEENYWLAREVADILAGVPGVGVKASKSDKSKAGSTVFTKVLKLCFECLGQYGSMERYAVAAAKQTKPVMIDDETWREYLAATSKGRKPRG